MHSHLKKEELLRQLEQCSGLIPVELTETADIGGRQLIWRDLERFHSYEGFFDVSLNTFAKLRKPGKPREATEFHVTDIDVLNSDQILTDNIYPTGFIFHAGRCGSTLLAKTLARSRSNLVFGESELHNKIWTVFNNDWRSPLNDSENHIQIYRRLILAMGRKRLETHKNHFIKFTSFNILFLSFIRSAFPDVPAIFLYRNPSAMLRSFLKAGPGWATNQITGLRAFITGDESAKDLSQVEFFEKSIERFFSIALRTEGNGLRLLNYEKLTPSILPEIFNAFNISPEPDQIAAMRDQFDYDAKTDYKLKDYERPYVAEQSESARSDGVKATTSLEELYQKLIDSDANI